MTAPAAAPQDLATATALLQAGQAQLQAGALEPATQALLQARQHPQTRLAAHNLIERHGLAGGFRPMLGLNCEIAEADDIFHFFAGHPTSINPLRDYLADGWRTLAELMLLLEAADRPLLKTAQMLEFASGHGRFTRHLVKALGPERVVVSDVVVDAMDFARRTFGVQAIDSSLVPEALAWPEAGYDLVFVLSLFSHLPQRTWSRWLASLYRAVQPGGLLVFSTHGAEAASRQGVQLDADGFFFAPSSESQAIEVAEYGTTFTADAYVRRAVASTLPGAQLLQHAPVHFWNHQDAYVVAKPLVA